MGKDPAMPFYVNDYLSSRRVQAMSQLQELAYVRLLFFCWASGDASIPDDDAELAKISRMGKGWLKGGSTVVRKCFNQHPAKPGFLTNKRVFELWEERQQWREKSRDAGIKSGEIRRSNRTKVGSRLVQPNTNSSSSSSSSSSYKGDKSPLDPLPFDTESFREAWSEWQTHRREKHKPLTPTSLKKQFAELLRMGEERAIAAIQFSITKGYQGIFEEGRQNGPVRHNSGRPSSDSGRGSL